MSVDEVANISRSARRINAQFHIDRSLMDSWLECPLSSSSAFCDKVHTRPPLRSVVHHCFSRSMPDSVTYAFNDVTEADIEQIRELHSEWFPVKYDESFFTSLFDTDMVLTLTVRLSPGGPIIGLCIVALDRPEERFSFSSELLPHLGYDPGSDFISYILTLGVVDELRGRGIAGQMLSRAEHWVKSNRPQSVAMCLHVIEYNTPALGFYVKNKFRIFKNENQFYEINQKSFNGIFLFRVLK